MLINSTIKYSEKQYIKTQLIYKWVLPKFQQEYDGLLRDEDNITQKLMSELSTKY
jgi:hypothetical protein